MAKVTTRNRNKNQVYKDGRKKPANWEYRFEMAKVNGVRQHASKAGFKTQKEALAAGTQALAEYLNSGQMHKPSEISVSDYLDLWLEQYVAVNLKHSSYITYSNAINNHIRPSLGHYKLQSLSSATLLKFANNQKEKGFTKKHITLILGTLKSALKYAVEPLQYIKVNPMTNIKVPKISRKKKDKNILNSEEWNKIIEKYPFGHRYHIPLMIGFHTGLRIGEVFGLTWDDVDFKNGTITVNKQQIRYKANPNVPFRWCIAPPKSKASVRTIKIGQTLIDTLKKEQMRQKQNKLAYGEYYTRYETKHIKEEIYDVLSMHTNDNDINLISVTDNGEWLTQSKFRSCAEVINHKLNIKFDFHALRHTHATWLAENGVQPKSLQMRLGHEHIETTLNTYIHDTDTMQDNTIDIFEKLVSGQK